MPKLAIIGCGGVGSWAALTAFTLMKNREIEEIYLCDEDKILSKNVARQPLFTKYVGWRKGEALQSFAFETLGLRRTQVLQYDHFITVENIHMLKMWGITHVFYGGDHASSENLVREFCRDERIWFHKGGYDGDMITVTDAPFITLLEGEDGYTQEPEVFQAQTAGVLGIYSLFRQKLHVQGALRFLHVQDATNVHPEIRDIIEADTRAKMIGEGFHKPSDCRHEGCIKILRDPQSRFLRDLKVVLESFEAATYSDVMLKFLGWIKEYAIIWKMADTPELAKFYTETLLTLEQNKPMLFLDLMMRVMTLLIPEEQSRMTVKELINHWQEEYERLLLQRNLRLSEPVPVPGTEAVGGEA